MCFSLIFKKTFIGLVPWMGKGRFRSLAEHLGLNSRILCTLEDIKQDFEHLVSDIDYEPIQEWFDRERCHSLDYLRASLRIRKDEETLSDYDVSRLLFQQLIHGQNSKMGVIDNRITILDSRLLEQEEQTALLNSRLLEQAVRIDQYETQITQMQASKSWRIGRSVTFLPRKIRGGIRCYKDNGMRYTLKRFWYKVYRLMKQTL